MIHQLELATCNFELGFIWVYGFGGLERWNGMVEWTGLEWNGMAGYT